MTSDATRSLLSFLHRSSQWLVWNLRGRPRVDLLDYVKQSITKGLEERDA